MSKTHDPGRYTLFKLGRHVLARGPDLARGIPDLLAGLRSENSLGLPTHLAVQVRMARLLSCPVCMELFPRLAPEVAAEVQRLSTRAFQTIGCRDAARLDLRIDSAGKPWLLEINSMVSIHKASSFYDAAQAEGMSYTDMIGAILDAAVARY